MMSYRATTREEVAALAQELERQKQTKRDFICPAKDIGFISAPEYRSIPEANVPVVANINMGDIGQVLHEIGLIAHQQFADKLGIGAIYYNRCLEEAPDLLTDNANYWLQRSKKVHLIRTLDGRVRAFLSDRYRVLDNVDLFFETYRVVQQVGAEIVRADLTEERFYMRVLHPEWREKVQLLKRNGTVGADAEDVVPGTVVSNSEVGRGGLRVEPFMLILICVNGVVMDHKMWQFHLGKKQDLGFLSEETKEAEDKAIWLRVRDTITATFDREIFRQMVARMNDAAAAELENPIEAVDNVVAHYGFTDEEKQRILNELISPNRKTDPGRTVYGLLNAVTAVGRDQEDYNKGIQFERAGGQLLENRELVEIKVRQ